MAEEQQKLKAVADLDKSNKQKSKDKKEEFFKEARLDLEEKKQMREMEIKNRPQQLWADRQLMYRNARAEIEREERYKDMFRKINVEEQKRAELYKQNVYSQIQKQNQIEEQRQKSLEQKYILGQIIDENKRQTRIAQTNAKV